MNEQSHGATQAHAMRFAPGTICSDAGVGLGRCVGAVWRWMEMDGEEI